MTTSPYNDLYPDEHAPLAHEKVCALRTRAAELRTRADQLEGPVADAVSRQAAKLELQAYLLQQRFLVPVLPLSAVDVDLRQVA